MSDTVVTHPFSDPRQQHEAASFGMWIFLATEVMFFGVLFGSYIATRIVYSDAFAEASRHTNVLLGTLNTAVLLRPGNAMERWDGRIYWRALARGWGPAAIATIMLKRKEVEAWAKMSAKS
jgi:heme/copper-type cytochrome/quinol oxidase subunit 3